MRLIGLALVLAGALVLGYHGLTSPTNDPEEAALAAAPVQRPTPVLPVLGGMSVALGLLLLVMAAREAEN